ncbi:uncharacterized protein LOC124125320 [Haliotis rufescens]|uniref:uncharacterized protein LOC124125320 n=1 Tax=Haliotis rufescens TaxID=6454 RepID=UPI001EB00179|nr:uncharacterized protein LOC124125320 [Haliotis rufescens]
MELKTQCICLQIVFLLISLTPGYATVFYHYTDEAGADAIEKSGYIRQSTNPRYAHFGKGVYGTGMGPASGKAAIAKNNYQGGWEANLRRGRVDYAFRFDLPSYKVNRVSKDRDILLYKGDLILKDNPYKVYA